jgi:predicted DNA-binding transcriptional regulator AlpA
MQPDLIDKREVCRLFGGSKPIDASTLYRGIAAKRYPKPVKVGPGSSRWLRSEVDACLRQMTEARHG